LPGLPHHILPKAIEKARLARLIILQEMAKTIAEPRKEVGASMPRASLP